VVDLLTKAAKAGAGNPAVLFRRLRVWSSLSSTGNASFQVIAMARDHRPSLSPKKLSLSSYS